MRAGAQLVAVPIGMWRASKCAEVAGGYGQGHEEKRRHPVVNQAPDIVRMYTHPTCIPFARLSSCRFRTSRSFRPDLQLYPS